MESIPAGTTALQQPSVNTTRGEVGAVATETQDASAPSSFADLLQISIESEAPQEATPAGGQTVPQGGQAPTGSSGNSWPLLLPGTAAPDPPRAVLAAVASAVEENPLQHSSKKIAETAAEGLLAAGKSLLAGGAVRFGAALEGVGPLQEAGKGLLLMPAATHGANLQLSGIASRTADLVGQNLFYPTTTQPTSAEAPMSMEPARFVISPRLDASQWEHAFGSRLVWMAKEQHQFVELRLNPPELGWVNVRMALHENDANIAIGVHNAAVREAIETSLPKLRELLAESGVSLLNVDVASSHGFAHDGRGSAGSQDGDDFLYGAFTSPVPDPVAEMEAKHALVRRGAEGFIDRYA